MIEISERRSKERSKCPFYNCYKIKEHFLPKKNAEVNQKKKCKRRTTDRWKQLERKKARREGKDGNRREEYAE